MATLRAGSPDAKKHQAKKKAKAESQIFERAELVEKGVLKRDALNKLLNYQTGEIKIGQPQRSREAQETQVQPIKEKIPSKYIIKDIQGELRSRNILQEKAQQLTNFLRFGRVQHGEIEQRVIPTGLPVYYQEDKTRVGKGKPGIRVLEITPSDTRVIKYREAEVPEATLSNTLRDVSLETGAKAKSMFTKPKDPRSITSPKIIIKGTIYAAASLISGVGSNVLKFGENTFEFTRFVTDPTPGGQYQRQVVATRINQRLEHYLRNPDDALLEMGSAAALVGASLKTDFLTSPTTTASDLISIKLISSWIDKIARPILTKLNAEAFERAVGKLNAQHSTFGVDISKQKFAFMAKFPVGGKTVYDTQGNILLKVGGTLRESQSKLALGKGPTALNIPKFTIGERIIQHKTLGTITIVNNRPLSQLQLTKFGESAIIKIGKGKIRLTIFPNKKAQSISIFETFEKSIETFKQSPLTFSSTPLTVSRPDHSALSKTLATSGLINVGKSGVSEVIGETSYNITDPFSKAVLRKKSIAEAVQKPQTIEQVLKDTLKDKTQGRGKSVTERRNTTIPKLGLVTEQTQRMILQPVTRLKQEQQLKTRMAAVQVYKTSLIELTRTRSILVPPFSKKGKGGTSSFPSFDVFVRRRGKFEKIASGLPEGMALKRGSKSVLGTAAATFKLVEKGRTTRKDIKMDYGELKQKFRKKDDTFIEKNKFRIDTGGELHEITFKGLQQIKYRGFKNDFFK